MCLTINKSLQLKFDDNDEITLYKIIITYGHLRHSGMYHDFEFRIGENVALYNNQDGSTCLPEEVVSKEDWLYIEYGFHVFLRLSDAWHYVAGSRSRKIIKVVCKKKHLIGLGYWNDTLIPTGAFTRIRIDSFDPVYPDASDKPVYNYLRLL